MAAHTGGSDPVPKALCCPLPPDPPGGMPVPPDCSPPVCISGTEAMASAMSFKKALGSLYKQAPPPQPPGPEGKCAVF